MDAQFSIQFELVGTRNVHAARHLSGKEDRPGVFRAGTAIRDGQSVILIEVGGPVRRRVALLWFLHDEGPDPGFVPISPPTIRQQNHSRLTLVRRRPPASIIVRGSSHTDSVSTSETRT
ncbi:hypothetical protein AS032_32270 [Rhodococcus qingshengii]|nr:hypothetical protein ABM90_10730 [Rhodococcus erythropolis]KSU66293.1 hypothetical protein AS032_32270 [Rhodococcus qingshengii]OFE10517.1 hypothetical protein A5N83_02125 [Rhodococcus sp. 1139]